MEISLLTHYVPVLPSYRNSTQEGSVFDLRFIQIFMEKFCQ